MLQRYEEHLVLDAGAWSERNERNRALATRVHLEGMQETGLQIANVAGRDLLLGPDELQRLQNELGIQFLSANIFVDGKLRFQPFVVLQKQLGGRAVRIGITAVTAPSQVALEEWPAEQALEFTEPLAAARQMLDALRPQTDLRILLAHVPLAKLEEFARDEPFGYDLLVCGTGESRETIPVGPAPAVLSPGTRAKHLAWVILGVPAKGETSILGGQVLALDEKIADDPAVATLVGVFKQRLAAANEAEPHTTASSEAPEAESVGAAPIP